MPSVFISLIGFAFALNTPIATAEPHRKVLSGQEIRKVFIGKITTDSTHFAYHLKPDGKIIGNELGRSRKGTWAIQSNQLCLSVPMGAPADCWTVVRLDGNLVFRRDGVDVMEVTVEKFSAKYHFD
ncbi:MULTISPECIES: hypothetical protein [Limnobacter]|jgi:hypothetical protein|uniref:Dihydrodipicolinate reductase n=1 Tax=Limnobacter profundi TaxID=2732163 RepID=A0ABX6N5C8_9BURK|nr:MULTISPECIES: hypothetical protein [unclassified Limnobacter]MAG81114.1 hypothetical protein [Sutterellaceae bacterium]MDZ4051140.1 hypothetical protein [Limnobacter sp.]QJR29592.1 hypothetical protein HKT17_07625 [Limnobacter sp. SAORIC-580]|tara:strand:+ start:3097 stop:3474 length:378 start_codon:yes stop_codon:yes gene_type:complete